MISETKIIQFPKNSDKNAIINELFDEWIVHKKNLTFERYISERMPLFFGPLLGNISFFEKIKSAERHLKINFCISRDENGLWGGSITFDSETYIVPNFAIEDDIRIFIILLYLKLKSLQR